MSPLSSLPFHSPSLQISLLCLCIFYWTCLMWLQEFVHTYVSHLCVVSSFCHEYLTLGLTTEVPNNISEWTNEWRSHARQMASVLFIIKITPRSCNSLMSFSFLPSNKFLSSASCRSSLDIFNTNLTQLQTKWVIIHFNGYQTIGDQLQIL